MKCSKSIFKHTHMLYLFGFFYNFRPADPFLYEFFISHKNLSEAQVRHNILTVPSYSSVVLSVFVLLFSDIIGYKSLIVVTSLSRVIATCVRIWTFSVWEMQISEVFSGFAAATEVGYYIYLYRYNDVTSYQKITAYVIGISLLGKATSAGLAQLTRKWLDFEELHYINVGTVGFAAILSIFLPNTDGTYESSSSPTRKEIFFGLKTNFVSTFHEEHVTRWFFWYTCSLCSYTQVSTFTQTLWKVKEDSGNNSGAADACSAGVALFFVFLANFKQIDWKTKIVLKMHILTGLQYVLFFIGMTFFDTPFLYYGSYGCFLTVHYFVMVAMGAEISKIVVEKSFGLIFGFLYLVAAVLNAVMVCIISDDLVFMLQPQTQFIAYFGTHFVVYLVGYIILQQVATAKASGGRNYIIDCITGCEIEASSS